MKKIVLIGWPCDAEDIRSRLSHDWLGNRILRLNAEVVAEMHGENSDDREEFESYLLPGGRYEQYLGDLKKLADTVVDGYSPARLVATVLNTLPKSTQDQIKTVIHKTYLNACINGTNTIENLQDALSATVNTFEATLTDFCKSWFGGRDVSAQTIKCKFENVLRQASDLKEVLSQLPRGIILP